MPPADRAADPELLQLVKDAVEAFERMSPARRKELQREQAISFVYGNVSLCNPQITRKMVEDAYDRAR